MEYKKVLYASVVLNDNGHSVLHVVFEEPQPPFNKTFSREDAAKRADGSYYIMDNGVMHSCYIHDGRITGPTYAHSLNDHYLYPCIDVITYLDCGGDKVCYGEKQISIQFAEKIFDQFNLPFMIKKDVSNGITYEIVPNRETLDSLIGTTHQDTEGIDFTITWFHLPNCEGWTPVMIYGYTSGITGDRASYRQWNDIPLIYPGIIGEDAEFRDLQKWYPGKNNNWL